VSQNPKVVRSEKRNGPGRYPSEIVWLENGTWTIPTIHLGAWTGRTPADGESPEAQRQNGGRITCDELHWSVVGLANDQGWKLSPKQAFLLQKCAGLLDINSPAYGTAHLNDPELASDLQKLAERAVNWLNESVAPPGRHFVLEDALYLIED
jgi:hypothetical protein